MAWTCTHCEGELAIQSASSVEDSDGRSADATVTTWLCAGCGARFGHWLMPRAAFVEGKVVDASTERWVPSAPKLVFVEPWYAIVDASKYDAELAREIASGHPVFGKHATAIARDGRCDDVLFATDDAFYVVHLVWHGKREKETRWPRTTAYRTLGRFAERMLEDAADFADY